MLHCHLRPLFNLALNKVRGYSQVSLDLITSRIRYNSFPLLFFRVEWTEP